MLFCDLCGQPIDPNRLKTDENGNTYCSQVCKDIAKHFLEADRKEKSHAVRHV